MKQLMGKDDFYYSDNWLRAFSTQYGGLTLYKRTAVIGCEYTYTRVGIVGKEESAFDWIEFEELDEPIIEIEIT